MKRYEVSELVKSTSPALVRGRAKLVCMGELLVASPKIHLTHEFYVEEGHKLGVRHVGA